MGTQNIDVSNMEIKVNNPIHINLAERSVGDSVSGSVWGSVSVSVGVSVRDSIEGTSSES